MDNSITDAENTGSNTQLNNCLFEKNTAIYGGGMSCYTSSPILTNCTFRENSVYYTGPTTRNHVNSFGGGMYNGPSSNPILTNCTFVTNASGAGGGGMYNDSDSKPILTKCTFSGNLADNGGGIYSFENNPELIDCVFTSNSANPEGGGIAFIDCYHITLTRCEFSANEAEAGGGIYLKRSYVTTNLTMTGCTFTGNFALFSGGGVNCSSALENGTLNGMLTNCLFTGNQATEGTAIKCGVVKQWKIMNCTIAHNKAIFYGNGNVVDIVSSNFLEDVVLSASNCIVWGNQIGQKPQSPVDDIFQNIHQLNWTYSLIEGGQSGEGNIDVDPDFVNPGYWVLNNNPVDPDDDIWVDGDYHLKSQAGRWDPNSGN